MNEFAGDGTNGPWTFNFAGGYISRADVKAYSYDSASGITTERTLTFLSDFTVTSDVVIPVGQFIIIYRDTQKTVPLVDYSTGAVLDEQNLDTSNKQAIFVAAEMVDRFDAINATSAEAIERSFTALQTAQQAESEASAAVATANAANTTAGSANTKADAAVTTANDAHDIATGIDGKAQQALDNSIAAVATADDASTTAHGIDAKAQTALDNSTAAVTTANNASDDADAALSVANGIDAKAQTALDNSSAAQTAAGNAVSTANAAAAAAAAALQVADQGKPLGRAVSTSTATFSALTATKMGSYTSFSQSGGSMWDGTNQRWKPTKAGWYRVVSTLIVNVNSAQVVQNISATVSVYKNGALYASNFDQQTPAAAIAAGFSFNPKVDCMVQCNGTTDYLETWVFLQAASLSSSPALGGSAQGQYFEVEYIGPL
jgi:hypothetical protein